MNKGLQDYLYQKRAEKMLKSEQETLKDSQQTLPQSEAEEELKKQVEAKTSISTTSTPQLIKKKIKKIWKQGYKVVNVSDPEMIPPQEKTKYKFKVKLEYQDEKNKQHKQNMKIGKKNAKYRIEGISKDQAVAMNSTFLKCQNPFDKNYWVIHLLNSGDNIYLNRANYMDMIKKQ